MINSSHAFDVIASELGASPEQMRGDVKLIALRIGSVEEVITTLETLEARAGLRLNIGGRIMQTLRSGSRHDQDVMLRTTTLDDVMNVLPQEFIDAVEQLESDTAASEQA